MPVKPSVSTLMQRLDERLVRIGIIWRGGNARGSLEARAGEQSVQARVGLAHP